MTSFLRQCTAGVRMLLALTLLAGVLYPAAVWGAGQAVARDQAAGSLVRDAGGQVVGSSLLGQLVEGDQWFQGRPSASDASGETSGGSNLGPSDPRLATALAERRTALLAANPDAPGDIPADALTASASGLDPHISPAYALWQVPRVAKARSLSETEVRQLVQLHTHSRVAGFLGQPRVNVLELNLALAALSSEH